MLEMCVDKSCWVRLLGDSGFVGLRWDGCLDAEIGHNPYKPWPRTVRTRKSVPKVYRSCHWRTEKDEPAQKRASCTGWPVPWRAVAWVKADEWSVSSCPWAPAGMQGKMGSICCFARLIISSGILWLNFCEARGLTSLLMMGFFVSSLYEWPQILNRYKFSHKFLDLELTQGSPHHQKSGSLEIKDLTLTS